MDVLVSEYLDVFWDGLWITIRLTAISFVLAVVLGVVLATCRISPIRPLRIFGLVFVEIFRNVPLVSLLILVVYGLPEINVKLSYMASVILAMTLVGAAFACETFRSGINSIGVGQVEAARSIGLTFSGIVREIIVPQSLRSMIGPIVSLFVGVLLSSSLASVVGVRELTATVSYINNREALGLTTFLVAAVIYATISLSAGALGARAEKRLQVLR